ADPADRSFFAFYVFESFETGSEKNIIWQDVFRRAEDDGVAPLRLDRHRSGRLHQQNADLSAQQTRGDDGTAGDVDDLSLRNSILLEKILLAGHPKAGVSGGIDSAVSEV